MKKLILLTVTILGVLIFIAAIYLTTQNQNLINQPTSYAILSPETITSLESIGFAVAGQYFHVRSPRMLDSTNLPETAHLKLSLEVRKAKDLQITWLGTPEIQKIAGKQPQNNIILVKGFERDFTKCDCPFPDALSPYGSGWCRRIKATNRICSQPKLSQSI